MKLARLTSAPLDEEKYAEYAASMRNEIMKNNTLDLPISAHVIHGNVGEERELSTMVDDAEFANDSEAFARFKEQHPDASYSVYWTTNTAKQLRKGAVGNSLGNNIVKHSTGESEFWKTGERQAANLMKIGKVERHHRVVEYGVGSLRVAGHFMKLLEPANFIGLDIIPDFFEMGIENVGRELVDQKRPKLAVISEESVAEAAAFQPDFVYSHAVIQHVHPDELPGVFSNLSRITCKPGAVLAFNTALCDEPVRYKSRSWAWPMQFYLDQLPHLEHVDAKVSKPSNTGGYEMRSVMLIFRRPGC